MPYTHTWHGKVGNCDFFSLPMKTKKIKAINIMYVNVQMGCRQTKENSKKKILNIFYNTHSR